MDRLSGWCFLHLVEERFYKAGYFFSLIHFFNYSFILSAIIELLSIPMHASRVILAAVTNKLQNFSGLTKYQFNSGSCNSPVWMLLGGSSGTQVPSILWNHYPLVPQSTMYLITRWGKKGQIRWHCFLIALSRK